MVAEGLQLLIDSSRAAAGAKQFEEAIELAATASEALNEKIVGLERELANYAKTQERTSRDQRARQQEFFRSIEQEIALLKVNGAERQKLRVSIEAENRARELGIDLQSDAGRQLQSQITLRSQLAAAETDLMRRQTSGLDTTGRFMKQLGTNAIQSATGVAGLGQALASVPALAIASAIGGLTARLVEFTTSAQAAEERQRRLTELSEEYRASLERLGGLAREREVQAILGVVPTDKTGLQAQADAIKVILADFERLKKSSTGTLQVDLAEQLKNLRVPPETIRDIDAVGARIKGLRDQAGQRVTALLGGGRDFFKREVLDEVGKSVEDLQKRLPSLRLKFEGLDAKLIIDPEALKTDLERQLQEVQKQIGPVPVRVQSVIDSQQQTVSLLGKESAEREKLLRLRQQEEALKGVSGEAASNAAREFDRINQLADARQKEIESATAAKKVAEDEAKAREKAAQAAAEEARELKERQDRIASLIDRKREEVALLQVEGVEREKLRAKLEVQRSINEAGNAITIDQVKALNELADAEARALQAADDATKAREARNKADQEAVRIERERQQAAERSAREEDRKADFLRTIEQEISLLRASGEERAKLKDAIDAENAAREHAINLKSEEGKKLQEDIKARRLLNEQDRKTKEAASDAGQLGAEIGNTIGQGLLDAARSGNSLRDSLRSIGDELISLAAKKLIIDNLTKLGRSILGGADEGTATSMTGNVFGAAVRPAQIGVVASSQTLRMGDGRLTSVAEGGGTTPEVVAPLVRDRRGRLGLAVSGGGQQITQNIVLPNVRTARDARGVGATLRQTVAQVSAAQRRQNFGLRGQ